MAKSCHLVTASCGAAPARARLYLDAADIPGKIGSVDLIPVMSCSVADATGIVRVKFKKSNKIFIIVRLFCFELFAREGFLVVLP
jgi:hypothetical protein